MEDYKYKYSGTLELYYETGFEGNAVILHDNRGIHKSSGYNNKTKLWDGPEESFKSLGWATFIRGEEYLKVFEEDKVIMEGKITKSRLKIAETNYSLSFVPKEVDTETWIKWCMKEYYAEISTNIPVSAEEEKNKKEF